MSALSSSCHCNKRVQQQSYQVEWSKIEYTGESISPRGSHTTALVQYNDRPHLIIYGGNNRYGEFYSSVHLYDIQSKTVQLLTTTHDHTIQSTQLLKSGHVTAYYNNHLYVFGGQYIYGSEESSDPCIIVYDTVYALNLTTLQWTDITQYNVDHKPKISGYNCSAFTQYDRYLITFGGASSISPTNDVRVYELQGDSCTKPTYQCTIYNNDNISAREMSSIAVTHVDSDNDELNVNILLSGGRSGDRIFDDMYNIKLLNQSIQYTNKHPQRCAHTLLSITKPDSSDYDIMSFGGTDGKQFYHELAIYNNHCTNNTSTPLNTNMQLNNTQSKCQQCQGAIDWIEIDDTNNSDLPDERIAHTLTRISGINDTVQRYILFGGLNQFDDFNDMWLLTVEHK